MVEDQRLHRQAFSLPVTRYKALSYVHSFNARDLLGNNQHFMCIRRIAFAQMRRAVCQRQLSFLC